MFWNTQRFEQLGVTRKFVLRDHSGKACKQVGMYVVLRNKETGDVFAGITCHFKSGAKPKEMPIKDAQARMVANIVRKELLGIPVLFGCDLNSNQNSQIFKTWQREAPNMPSSYNTANGEELDFTTCKWRKGGAQKDKLGVKKQTIDFIFYSEGDWQVRRTLDVPPAEKLEHLKMPGWKYPSDHFLISADIEYVR